MAALGHHRNGFHEEEYARWPRVDIGFHFLILFFFLLSFVIFVLFFNFLIFVYFLFTLLLLLFCLFSFLNFCYSSFFHLLLFFYSISFLKWNQMKTNWPRADIAPKINHDDRGLTYTCAAAVCWIFYLCHMTGHEASITFHQNMAPAGLVFMLLALKKGHHKNYFLILWYLRKNFIYYIIRAIIWERFLNENSFLWN